MDPHAPEEPRRTSSTFNHRESRVRGRFISPVATHAEKFESVLVQQCSVQNDLEEASRLVARSRYLEEEFKSTAAHFRARLSDSRFEHAQNRVAAWKSDVRALAIHFEAQLKFCRHLRNSEVMQSLLELSQGSVKEKILARAEALVSQLKYDARMLLSSTLMAQDPHTQELGRKIDAHESKVIDGTTELHTAPATSNETSSKDIIDDTIHSVSSIVDSISTYLEIQTRSCEIATEQLDDLQQLYSVDPDSETTEFGTFNASVVVSNEKSRASQYVVELIKLVKHSVEFAKLFKSIHREHGGKYVALAAKLVQSQENCEKLQSIVTNQEKEIELLKRVVSAKQGLAQNSPRHTFVSTTTTNVSANETATNFVPKDLKDSSVVPTRNHYLISLQLEEAILKQHELQKNCTNLKEVNASLQSQLQEAQFCVSKLEQECRMKDTYATMDALWFAPRMKYLEQSIQHTSNAFEHLALDLELLSSMFHESCKQCKQLEVRIVGVEADRNLLGEKLSRSIKGTRLLRAEQERVQKVNQLLVASREALIEENNDGRRERNDLKDSISGLDVKVRELEDENSALRLQLQEAKQHRRRVEKEKEKLSESLQEAWDQLVSFNIDRAAENVDVVDSVS